MSGPSIKASKKLRAQKKIQQQQQQKGAGQGKGSDGDKEIPEICGIPHQKASLPEIGVRCMIPVPVIVLYLCRTLVSIVPSLTSRV